MNRRQEGFTLVEDAIVLVIIGLLLGGILKGQELINSARVRNLADTATGIQAAYFGFIDRYRQVPGDWNNTAAGKGIGAVILGGGNDNGRLDNPDNAADTYDENNALWEQLSKGRFIRGAYDGMPGTEPDTSNNLAPANPYSGIISIGRTSDYEGVNAVRLQVIMGRGVPVNVMREFDVKLDDGAPHAGIVRATVATPATFARTFEWGGRDPACVALAGNLVWDTSQDTQDCNAAYLY
jgi:prepilin-type N-terminal cleavage/methylation domain-containing protein